MIVYSGMRDREYPPHEPIPHLLRPSCQKGHNFGYTSFESYVHVIHSFDHLLIQRLACYCVGQLQGLFSPVEPLSRHHDTNEMPIQSWRTASPYLHGREWSRSSVVDRLAWRTSVRYGPGTCSVTDVSSVASIFYLRMEIGRNIGRGDLGMELYSYTWLPWTVHPDWYWDSDLLNSICPKSSLSEDA